MEKQANAGPHAFLQLGVTSKRLRGELADVVMLPEAAQDQVADAVHDLVQHLLLGLRLPALPSGVQFEVLRAVGRHARLVSPGWKHTYGPLDCGSCFDSMRLGSDQRLTHRDSDHITALVLPEVSLPPLTIATVACYYPRLQSLALGIPDSSMAASDLKPLSSLKSYLTALSVQAIAPLLPGIASLQQLTSLRSLTFGCPDHVVRDIPDAVEALSCLSNLRALRYTTPEKLLQEVPQSHMASQLLPALGSLNLTSLDLDGELIDWDDAAVAVLRTALPRLSALTLCLELYMDSPSHNSEVVAALAGRSALTSLGLTMTCFANVACLSTLKLQHLHMGYLVGDGNVRLQLLEAFAAHRTLTSISIGEGTMGEGNVGQQLTGGELYALQNLGACLESLTLRTGINIEAGALATLAFMTRLRRLTVEGALAPDLTTGEWRRAALQLSRLSALEALTVEEDDGNFAKAVLASVSCLTNLKELSLHGSFSAFGGDVWQIITLKEVLTSLRLSSYHNAWDTAGPPLCHVLRQMTQLQHLGLAGGLQLLDDPRLPAHLLPLPPGLRVLHCGHLPEEVHRVLQAAADLQGCKVAVCEELSGGLR